MCQYAAMLQESIVSQVVCRTRDSPLHLSFSTEGAQVHLLVNVVSYRNERASDLIPLVGINSVHVGLLED